MKINLKLTNSPKAKPTDESKLGFGAVFSDHMLIRKWTAENGWEDACRRSIEILNNEGAGHTMTIHSEDESVIREFALQKPVSRLLVNTPGALGGVGATTGLLPALTLGCGSVGGSATSDNVSPLNLINIRRVAYGIRELDELRRMSPAPAPTGSPSVASAAERAAAAAGLQVSREDVEKITRAVLARLGM